MNNIGNRIKRARKSLGVSQKELANDIGVTPMTLYRYESGQVAVTVEMLTIIANALDIDVDMLLASDEKYNIYELFHFSRHIDYESPKIKELAQRIFELTILQEHIKESGKSIVFSILASDKADSSLAEKEITRLLDDLLANAPAEIGLEPPQAEDDLTPVEKKELNNYRDYLIWKRGRD